MREYEEPASQESKAKMKQRIVGGAVLALVLALFLPFIFSHSHLENTATETTTTNNTVTTAVNTAVSTPVSIPVSTSDNTAPKPPPTPIQAVKKTWVVQVASFTEPLYARELSIKLNHQGIKVFTQKDPTRPLVRVFIGPFATQTEAQQYQAHLKSKYKLDGIIKENHI